MACTTRPAANHESQQDASKPSSQTSRLFTSQHSIYARRALLRLADSRRSALRQSRIDRILQRFSKDEAESLYNQAKALAEFRDKDEDIAKDDQRRLEDYQRRVAEQEEEEKGKKMPAQSAWEDLSDDVQWGVGHQASPTWNAHSFSESDSEDEDDNDNDWGAGPSFSWLGQRAEGQLDAEEQSEPQADDCALIADLDAHPGVDKAHEASMSTTQDQRASDDNDDDDGDDGEDGEDERQMSTDSQQFWDDLGGQSAWDLSYGLEPAGNETPATSRSHSVTGNHNQTPDDDSDDDDFLLYTRPPSPPPTAIATHTGSLRPLAVHRSPHSRIHTKPTEKDAERIALLLQDRQWNQLRRKIKANNAAAQSRRERRRTMPYFPVRELRAIDSRIDPRLTIYNVVKPEDAFFHRAPGRNGQHIVSPLWQSGPQRCRRILPYRVRRLSGRVLM